MLPRLLCAVTLFAAGSLPGLLAQDAGAQKDSGRVAPTRIHVIGASVSGGFEDGPMWGGKVQGDSVPLVKVLKKWSDGEVKVSSHPAMQMWALWENPVALGKKQIDLAKRKKADLIVAIDFPFWFAYGQIRGEERAARFALQDKCFEYLKSLDVPVIIGDLPEMKGAVVRMLKPWYIPKPPLLMELDARLKKFADENPKITQVSFAKLVKQMKVGGLELPLADGLLKTAPYALLQPDRLHATRLGVAVMASNIQGALRAHFPEKHALRAQEWSFEEFVDAAKADVELDTLKEQAAAKK